jgi:AraC-like DNA-binding protein
MRRGNVHYNLVLAKLDSLYGCKIRDCYDNPEYLKTVLKQVYKKNYNSVINEIRLELGDLGVEEINDFINIMLKQ